jgi:hypothetical protein
MDVAGQPAWSTGGESVMFAWAHAPEDTTVAGGQVMMLTPPYVTLSEGSAFATPTSTLVRSQDLTLTWTTVTQPTEYDFVKINLSGPVGAAGTSTSVGCRFPASAGRGVIPADALKPLGAGQGSYDVHSQESQSETVEDSNGSAWTFGFNLNAHALTSSGAATGSITFQ